MYFYSVSRVFLQCTILENSEKLKRYRIKQKARAINSLNPWTKAHLESAKFCPVRRVQRIYPLLIAYL
jgi:hypothetical protein